VNTKPSQTLRFLEAREVFTLQEYLSTVDPDVGEQTRYKNLQNALRRSQAARVTRGLYASNLGVYRDVVPNVLLVAAKAAPDAVVSHHSALEALGVAHSSFRTVYYTTSRRRAAFEFRGCRFVAVAPPTPLRGPDGQHRHPVRVREPDVALCCGPMLLRPNAAAAQCRSCRALAHVVHWCEGGRG